MASLVSPADAAERAPRRAANGADGSAGTVPVVRSLGDAASIIPEEKVKQMFNNAIRFLLHKLSRAVVPPKRYLHHMANGAPPQPRQGLVDLDLSGIADENLPGHRRYYKPFREGPIKFDMFLMEASPDWQTLVNKLKVHPEKMIAFDLLLNKLDAYFEDSDPGQRINVAIKKMHRTRMDEVSTARYSSVIKEMAALVVAKAM